MRPVDVLLIVHDLFCSLGQCNFAYPIHVNNWATVVSSKLPTKNGVPFQITIECRNWQANQLAGMMFRYLDHAQIIFSCSLNTCWSRYVVCKELTHLLIDTEPRHFTKDPISLVQDLINRLPSVSYDHDVNSEIIAMIGAVEMLLPWSYRPVMEKMMEDGMSDYQIAVEFRAPETLVNLVLRSEYYKGIIGEAAKARPITKK